MAEKLYKAFDEGTKCLDFQYPTDGSWTEIMRPKLCKRGYHACRQLHHVFGYYPVPDSVWEVEGEVHSASDDKVVCSRMRLIRKIDLKDFSDEIVFKVDAQTQGYLWQYLKPNIKKYLMSKVGEQYMYGYALCENMVVGETEEEYDFFIKHAKRCRVKQSPWFCRKIFEKNPELMYLYVKENPELMKHWEHIIPRLDPMEIVSLYVKTQNFPKEIADQAIQNLGCYARDIIRGFMRLHDLSDGQLYSIYSMGKQSFVNDLIWGGFCQYMPKVTKFVQEDLERGKFDVVHIDGLDFDKAFLSILKNNVLTPSFRLLIALDKCSARVKTLFMLNYFDVIDVKSPHTFFKSKLDFYNSEEIEKLYGLLPKRKQYRIFAYEIAISPYCPDWILKKIAKSKRWVKASEVARFKINQ